MKSIYRRGLGGAFERLHPKLRERYSLTSGDDRMCLGRGTLDVTQHTTLLRQGLRASAAQNLLFPEEGEAVPFTIRNYAYEDALGRETVAWIRTFGFRTPRHFDAAMVYDGTTIVDYLGTHRNPATDLSFTVEDGGIRIRAHDQRLATPWGSVDLPRACAGLADVREWYDEADERYRIDVTVRDPVVGPLLSYRGSFTVKWHDCEEVPETYRPVGEERV